MLPPFAWDCLVGHYVVKLWTLILDICRLLVGASAATAKERPFFVGQLARIASSYGGYHLDMLTGE
jgi:hypothetical protein